MRSDLLSVPEVAKLLNVSNNYVVMRLLRTYELRPIFIIHGRRFVPRSTAEAYREKRRTIARRALRDLTGISEDSGLYGVSIHDKDSQDDNPV